MAGQEAFFAFIHLKRESIEGFDTLCNKKDITICVLRLELKCSL